MKRWAPLLVLVGLLVFVYASQAREVCRPIGDGLQDCREYVGLEDVPGAILGVFLDWLGEMVQGLADLAEQFVLELLPVAPDLDIPSLTGLVSGYTFLNGIFPLSEGIAGGGIVLGVQVAILAFRTALTVWHVIPKPLSGT